MDHNTEAQAEIDAGVGQLHQKRGKIGLLIILPYVMTIIGFGLIFLAIGIDFIGIGSLPGFGARQFALTISGLAFIAAGIASSPDIRWKIFSQWLLLVVATVAIALIADMVVLNTGLPSDLDKMVMLSSLIFAILFVRAFPLLQEGKSILSILHDSILAGKAEIAKFLLVSVQFLLLLLLIQEFNLENEVFAHNIMMVAFFGYLLHSLLPLEYRLPFFLFISLGAILGVFGLLNGAWLIGFGLILIGICHLPIRFSARIVLLIVVGALLAFLRADSNTSFPWSNAIWPILGSMFMFRLIVYMYDMKHQKEPFQIWQSLSYFFLLPNVVFPLFPVVDYSNFRRTYFNEERFKTYQVGVNWMFRGAIQLIIYRLISYNILIAPEDITNFAQLVVYLVANISLYLRVSGQFHIIIGMLHMFGFNLPETNHNYFLASSFTDFWRRINIYWKDFMLKVFYYPLYFRIKKWGATTSLVIATLFVFFITWLLHAYQWFWLRGSFLLSTQDMLFWTVLALLVTVNALYENKRGRKRSIGKRKMSTSEYLSLGLKTVGTFATITVLWSLWTSVSLPEWFALWSISPPKTNGASACLFLLAFGMLGVCSEEMC
jgi:D-alanyl-lipoteichoic acid acyltransferase DltB (MBOAT superfamily)